MEDILMGFDLSGQEPRTEKGEYFRNNVWWWRPLWVYIYDLKLITKEQAERGMYNDGYVIPKDQALKIGARLKHEMSQGNTQKYADKYKKDLNAMPKERCDLCDGTGTRNDKIVQGKCNGCNGKGVRDSWAKSYPFSVKNVEEFAQFCIESGGFSIC
jgi:hypothetical protein